MSAMNTCPATIHRTDRNGVRRATRCGGALRFVGISIHRTYGWRRWSQCDSPYCGVYVATAEVGGVAVIQKTEPPKAVFRSHGLGHFEETL